MSEPVEVESPATQLSMPLDLNRIDILQATLSRISDGVILTDARGCIRFLNPVAESLTGWNQGQAQGVALKELLAVNGEQSDEALERESESEWSEVTFPRGDGTSVNVTYSSSPLMENGEIRGAVVVLRDVSERKRLENDLRRSEQTYRAIGESIQYGVWICSPDGRNTYASESFLQLVGLTQEQCSDFGWGKILHPDDADNTIAKWRECVRTGGDWNVEHRFLGVDGNYHWMLARGVPIKDERGEVIFWAGINLDIDDLKANEARLRTRETELHAANVALVRANEDLSQFAFAASHDLQEPLRMVSSYSELLVKGYPGKVDGEAALCVRFITQGTRRMRELLAGLLDYTQVSADNAGEDEHYIDLNLALDKVLDNCKTAIDDHAAVVDSDRLPIIRGYEPHFVQLLQNLIGNAIKYRGQEAPRVHVSATQTDSGWTLAVADNGMGIAPQYQEKIFGVFKRLHGKEIAGTGIGLAICQRVVERYGGKIWVESELGRGSTFFCSLPDAKRGVQ